MQDSVHCALEMSRLQIEDWKNQGPMAQEEALIQKALLQEELVTIRARMCDVSLVRWFTVVSSEDIQTGNICELGIFMSLANP